MSEEERKGLVPALRFPEFKEVSVWNKEALGSPKIAYFVKERVPLGKLSLNSYVSTENLLPEYAGISKASKLPPSGSFTHYKKNDVLISNIRPYLKKIWSADKDGAASNDVIVIRSGSEVSSTYLLYTLKNDDFISYVMRGAKGVKMPRGDLSSIKKYPVAYPHDNEQQKIADCLSAIDELIIAQNQKFETLTAHKKGLIQQLFPAEGETIPKLRFPEFRNKGVWKNRVLADFITERNETPRSKVSLHSLTIENGVTPKTERYERSFLVKDGAEAYKIVWQNDFAYNPMNLRFGAIGRYAGEQNVALSKYYNIFYCNKSVDSRFCEIYFKTHEMITHYNNVATGSLIEKRRVHFSEFLKFKILFPSLDEQKIIADCLSFSDELIAAQSEKIEVLKAHKKGLMQQLFPAVDEVSA